MQDGHGTAGAISTQNHKAHGACSAITPARDAASLVAAARALAPEIRQCRGEIEHDRSLPKSLVATMADSGFFSLWLARAYGGPELDFSDFTRVVEELSRADGSVGWCAMVGSVFSRLSGFLAEDTARHIFGDGRSILAGSINPSGRAVPVPGGYSLNGRWAYGSCIQHSHWTVANSVVYDGDAPRRDPSGAIDIRFMIVPTSAVEIIDTWHVSGLRGTGSHDFQARDLFVPEDHALPAFTAQPRQSGVLYATPMITVFAASLACVSIGIARSALDAFVTMAEHKKPMGSPAPLREKPMAQAELGRAEATVRAGRAFLMDSVATLWDEVASGGVPTLHQRAIVRLAAAEAARAAAAAVDRLFNAAGGSALFEAHVLERCFRDVHATTQHIGTNAMNYELAGRVLLGLDPGTPRF